MRINNLHVQKQWIVIIALLLAAIVRSSVNGESTNSSAGEILLAPEMDINTPSTSKSPLEPHDLHDQPPQLQLVHSGSGNTSKKPSTLQIPQVQIPRLLEPQSVGEVSHDGHVIDEPSTEESSGLAHSEQPNTEEVVHDVEYASGNEGTDAPWESGRIENAVETSVNQSSKVEHANTPSGFQNQTTQTEVVYDAVTATATLLPEIANGSYAEKTIGNLSEQNYASVGYFGRSNASENDPIIASTLLQGTLMESLVPSSILNLTPTKDVQYGISQIGELHLLQTGLTTSFSESVGLSTTTPSLITSWNYDNATGGAPGLHSSSSVERTANLFSATHRVAPVESTNNDSSNFNRTLEEEHMLHVDFAGQKPDSPENSISHESISPTKSPTDEHVQVLDGKVVRPKPEEPVKELNDSEKDKKPPNPTGDISQIGKDQLDDNPKVGTQHPSLSDLVSSMSPTSNSELVSSVLVTQRPNFTEMSSTFLGSFTGNGTIFPTPVLNSSQNTTSSIGQREVTPAAGKLDHILPTVKIPTTYLSMTMRCSWSYFCLHQDDLRNIFAHHLTNATKFVIRRSQVVFFNTNVCKHISYSENEVNGQLDNTIVVQMYVINKQGSPSERLTERLGYALVKNKLQGFNDRMKLQDVVLAVQLHRKERTQKSLTQPQEDDSDMGIIAAITISSIAGVCLALLCILLVVLKRRQMLKQQRRRCRPVVADAYSLDSISIYSSFYKRKMRASKRSYLNQGFEDPNAPTNKLNFTGLAALSTDENALAEEYKQIPMAMAKLEDLPAGADLKNRYANVIPFPETRVQLPAKTDDPSSGYINANFVRGFRTDQRGYIACQAPLETTVSDFWQMIWENQSKVIIMLTDWEEEGVAKCFPYFAESTTMDSHRRFGDFQVTTKKIDTRDTFTISSIQLKNLEKNLMRDVVHYWYTAWPALGVPNERQSILEMLAEARSVMRTASGPTIVHCSPGTGRTGTVLAIHVCTQEYEASRTVDIPQCVYRLRRDRGGCVQTSEQYKFIYEVLHEFASQLRNPSGRSSVRSAKNGR